MPDLIDDEKVFAIALMQYPIRLVNSQRERVEGGFTDRGRGFFDLWPFVFRRFLNVSY